MDFRTESYKRCYEKLSVQTQLLIDSAWEKYKVDPKLVRFELKAYKIVEGERLGIYSARVDLNYRALAIKKADGTLVWFWVGSHVDYDRILKPLS